MSAVKKRQNNKDLDENCIKNDSPDGGHNPYWSSSLFNEVYLRNDVPRKYKELWDTDEDFERFHQEFHNFVIETQDENFSTWSETDTINNWIVHIMEMLGWHDKCTSSRQTPYIAELSFTIADDGRKRTYRADLVYVDEPKFKQYITRETSPEDRLREARSDHMGTLLVLEAKYWDRLEETRQNKLEEKKRVDIEQDDGTRHLDPNDQILKYMDILQRDFGILTDGKTWRLFHKELSRGDVRRYFEFDLGNLAELVRKGIDNEKSRQKYLYEARYFYHFFKKASLIQRDTKIPFVYEVLEYSKKYATSIVEDLKDRFILAMGIACNALGESLAASSKELNLDLIRNVAESHLFNILFIRSCESRRILPLNAPAYHKLSLTEIIETLDYMNFDPEKGFDLYVRFFKIAFGSSFEFAGTEIFDRLLKLYKIVNEGDMGFEVKGFKESVFSKEEWSVATKQKIDNKAMLHILFNINFTDSEFGSRKYQQIPYNFFTPRQLGSIYESFLEFKLALSNEYMVFTKRQWKPVERGSSKVKELLKRGAPEVLKGQLYFTPDNEDRKMTGSYYTPDYIVTCMVQDTLETLCKTKSSKDLLKVRVCDPAMGSGHFLSGALNYLTELYRQKVSDETLSDVTDAYEETARAVLDSCIFGVDINPRAVKLAKMSLWLSTALANRKLERLDDQLVSGNSLTEENLWAERSRELKDGFDVVIGNPPYARIQTLNHLDTSYLNFVRKKYVTASEGSFDIYAVFFELGYGLLKENGRLAFITPNTYQMSEFGKTFRRFLIETKSLQKVTDFRQHQVFKEASTYSCISVLTKEPNEEVEIRRLIESEVPIEDLRLFEINVGSEKFFEISKSRLPETDEKWSLAGEDYSNVIEKLCATKSTLKDEVEKIYQGVATSADKVFVLDLVSDRRNVFIAKSPITDQNFELEKDICRYFLYGKDISRFSNEKPRRVAIFPYIKHSKSGKYELIDPEEFRTKYPKAYKYIERHKETLEKREGGKYVGATFYQYSRPQSLNEFDSPKVMMRNFSLRSQVTLDTTGDLYFTTNIYGVNFKRNNQEYLLYMLALLNSNVTWFFVKSTSAGLRGGYYQYKTKYLLPLPIVEYDSAKARESSLVKKIIANTVAILKNPRNLELQIENDKAFYKLYNLSKQEIAVIERSTNYDSFSIDEDDIAAA